MFKIHPFFRLYKPDGFGIILNFLKNSAAVCFFYNVQTGKDEKYQRDIKSNAL